jgi:hypothetical protein
MAFIVVLIINCVIINKIMKVGTTRTWENLTPRQKLPIYISATIATLCWVGIITAAMFIGIDEA